MYKYDTHQWQEVLLNDLLNRQVKTSWMHIESGLDRPDTMQYYTLNYRAKLTMWFLIVHNVSAGLQSKVTAVMR